MILDVFIGERFMSALVAAPGTIRNLLLSGEVGSTTETICAKNNSGNSTSDIALLIGNVLVGNIPVKNIPTLLEGHLYIDRIRAAQIAQDIRREILAPVAHELAALQPQAEQNYAAALKEVGNVPPQQPAANTSIQQGPPLPQTPPQ